MSGESIGGVAVVGAVGGVAVLGIAAAAGCAYVAYSAGKLAGAGTALAVGGSLSVLGRHLEHRAEDRAALHAERVEWEGVLRDVATRNARIGALDAMLGADHSYREPTLDEAAATELPAPLVLSAQSLPELRYWCRQVDATLAVAEPEVVNRSTAALLRQVYAAARPEAMTGAGVVLDDGPSTPSATRTWDVEPVLADLARIVGRLAAGVGEAERTSVVAAAQRVLSAPSQIEARNRIDDVRVRLEEANTVAVQRRSQAIEAAALLQPLARAGVSAEPLRMALREVVAGRTALSPELTEQAAQFTAGVQHEADRIYLRRSITESLAELGYGVDEGFQTAIPKNGMLQVRRSEWSAHGVRMVLDEDKRELRAVVVRTETDAGWDEGRVDVEREKQWCGDLDKLAVSLAGKGIDYQFQSRSEAGVRQLPVVRVVPAETGVRAPTVIPRTLGRDPS